MAQISTGIGVLIKALALEVRAQNSYFVYLKALHSTFGTIVDSK